MTLESISKPWQGKARQGTPVQNNETLMSPCQVARQPGQRYRGLGTFPIGSREEVCLWVEPTSIFPPPPEVRHETRG